MASRLISLALSTTLLMALGNIADGANDPLQCWAPAELDAVDKLQLCDVQHTLERFLQKAQYCPYGVGYYCVTPYGSCQLYQPLCVGAPCYCPSVYGPVWGNVN